MHDHLTALKEALAEIGNAERSIGLAIERLREAPATPLDEFVESEPVTRLNETAGLLADQRRSVQLRINDLATD